MSLPLSYPKKDSNNSLILLKNEKLRKKIKKTKTNLNFLVKKLIWKIREREIDNRIKKIFITGIIYNFKTNKASC